MSQQILPPSVSGPLSSGFLSALTRTITAPWDTLKLAQQVNGIPLAMSTPKFQYSNYKNFTGICDIANDRGYSALWSGNLIGVIRCFIAQTFNSLIIKDVNIESSNLLIQSLVGTIYATLTLLLVHPLDTISTRLSMDCVSGKNRYHHLLDDHDHKFHHHHHSLDFHHCSFHGVSEMLKKDGFTSLYSGFGISIFGIFVHRILFYSLFKFLRPFFTNQHDYLFGEFVTVVASILSYPFDTIRRVQMLGGGNMIEAAQLIFNSNGYGGFFQGVCANTMRLVISGLLTLSYDFVEQQVFTCLA
eukprot:TRINITY_DN4201_c1_g1_i1.p1 TRINITY_DN4201_c1_g1~~TRINITY_DN4201_c1_g1_i1.p1  ORF type:complete len:301 (-),score=26.41 TRINITY_DN4201_c1_g1_i1:175-1077(-)